MNKEFIPYEQALELKELGFDEECLGFYKTIKGGVFTAFFLEQPTSDESVGVFITNTPLYQQAFRWFREKYNIIHEIVRKEDKNHREFIAWVYTENDKIEVVSYWTALPYKQAELACLKKLIEIVKNK